MSTIYRNISTQNLPGIGRQAMLASILGQLSKGDHVSVVGPRYTGKSCLMRALVKLPELRHRFVSVAYCDLRHEPLESNESFYGMILRQIREDGLCNEEWREYALPSHGISAWKTLEDLVKGMAEEKVKALIVLDGLDEAAVSGSVDVNAWNTFNRLIEHDGAQFVTTTRDRMEDIRLDPKSRCSLFFQRFGDVTNMTPVDAEELETWLAASPPVGCAVEKGAKTELLNQTGGHPQLLGALLHQLSSEDSPTSASTVQAAARKLVESRAAALWAVVNDLQPLLQEALTAIETPGALSSDVVEGLTSRLLAMQRKGKMEATSRMVGQMLTNHTPGEATLRSLFGEECNYFESMARALRLRLSQLGTGNNDLIKGVETFLMNLQQPKFAVRGAARTLLEDAIAVAHQVEIAGRPFPQFTTEGRRPPTEWHSDKPRKNLEVLDCLTDDRCGVRPKKITRAVWSLLNHLYISGNLSNHHQNQEITPGFAMSVAHTAVELLFEMKRCGML